MAKISFGKYAGLEITDVPEGYLEWYIKDASQRVSEYQQELERRVAIASASTPLVVQIVNEGYRNLARKAHPDAGGTDQEMTALNGAKEWLLERVRETQR